jgi:hypothetical protein
VLMEILVYFFICGEVGGAFGNYVGNGCLHFGQEAPARFDLCLIYRVRGGSFSKISTVTVKVVHCLPCGCGIYPCSAPRLFVVPVVQSSWIVTISHAHKKGTLDKDYYL